MGKPRNWRWPNPGLVSIPCHELGPTRSEYDSDLARRRDELKDVETVKQNLLVGVKHYRDRVLDALSDRREEFADRLDALTSELDRLR